MRKNVLVWLVAIVVLALAAPTVMAQNTTILDHAVEAKYDATNKHWIVTFTGKTRLASSDKSADSLSFSITDPNGQKYLYPLANITWTKPAPGETKTYKAVSDPVTVSGTYDFEIIYSYTDSNGGPAGINLQGKFIAN
jgi:hypothetical protein